MYTVIYDGSFDGLFTAVFEVYEYKLNNPFIVKIDIANPLLFGNCHKVITSKEKSERVYKKLKDKLSPNAFSQLYKTYLSEIEGIENTIYRYIAYALNAGINVEHNFSNPDVLMLQQTSRKVHKEKHRMEAFVRFQLTKDRLYYSIIQPDHNVLPLISNHFEKRYADQRWLIYDVRRKYGIYYDLHDTNEVTMNFEVDLSNKNIIQVISDEQEELYQKLWQQYFSSVNIAARKNMKLHIQHMPKRYWKYLVEKKGDVNGE